MSAQNVIIVGINGHLGQFAARAFVAAGWQVTGFGRSNRHPIAGVRFIAGDADDVAALKAAIAPADVVVNALNLPYDKWFDGRAEAQLDRLLTAMGSSGKTLLFPGNIYNYAAEETVITPATRQVPPTPRGAIRVRMEQMLADAAASGKMQVLILRAGDFFGPEVTGSWVDLIMLREANKRRLALYGTRGIGHAWAYLPDLGRAFEKLAWHREQLGAFETFHFAGHFVTPERFADAIVAAAPVPLKVSTFPRIFIAAMGLVSPLMREVAKMGYLWDHAMALSDPRLGAILGPDFDTPFETAIAETVAPIFAGQRAAA